MSKYTENSIAEFQCRKLEAYAKQADPNGDQAKHIKLANDFVFGPEHADLQLFRSSDIFNNGSLVLTSMSGMYLRLSQRKSILNSISVVSIIYSSVPLEPLFKGVNQMHIHIHDQPDQYLYGQFESTTRFINEEISQNKSVIVHCKAGISRSATIVLAYLVRYGGVSLDRAYQIVSEKRPVIDPNPGFRLQLVQWETNVILSDRS